MWVSVEAEGDGFFVGVVVCSGAIAYFVCAAPYCFVGDFSHSFTLLFLFFECAVSACFGYICDYVLAYFFEEFFGAFPVVS